MQCECFVRAAYVCAAQPLTLETIEEKLVKDQQQQLSSLQPRVPPSTEQLRSIAPQLDPTHLCSNTSPLPRCWRVPTSCRAPPPPPQL